MFFYQLATEHLQSKDLFIEKCGFKLGSTPKSYQQDILVTKLQKIKTCSYSSLRDWHQISVKVYMQWRIQRI